MSDEKPDFIKQMPASTKPPHMEVNIAGQEKLNNKLEVTRVRHHRGRRVGWVILLLIAVVLVVQYVNAAKYKALVQVIAEDRIGVNPTGEALDFGDLPRNKSAVRTVNLVSGGNTDSYIIVWKLGSISDLIKVDRNYFTLKAHTTEKLEFTASIPNSANYQYYKGQVTIFQIPKIW